MMPPHRQPNYVLPIMFPATLHEFRRKFANCDDFSQIYAHNEKRVLTQIPDNVQCVPRDFAGTDNNHVHVTFLNSDQFNIYLNQKTNIKTLCTAPVRTAESRCPTLVQEAQEIADRCI